MTIHIVDLQPIVALIAGLVVLMMPRVLNMTVAIYLIAVGVLGLLPHFAAHLTQ